MNGDISRIPIQSLSAVVSLTDIIPELPLPIPLQCGSSSETLLHDPNLTTANAFQCLQSGHDQFATYLEGFASDNVNLSFFPPALTSVLLRKASVFEQKRGFFGLTSQERFFTVNTSATPLKTQSNSWFSQDNVVNNSYSYTNSLDESNGSPGKKKKKRKKKKHKHRDDDDTSGTGGESNATTPAACGETTPNKFDETSPVTPTYGVVAVNADTNKLSFKIFKRPPNDGNLQTNALPDPTNPTDMPKKEKKKKRIKEKDRESRIRCENRSSLHSSPVSDNPTGQYPELSSSSLILQNNPSSFPDIISNSNGLSNFLAAEKFNQVHNYVNASSSAGNSNFNLPERDSTANIDLSLVGDDSLFDHLISSQNNLYRQQQQQQQQQQSNAAGDHSKSMMSSASDLVDAKDLSNHPFPTDSNLFYELLRNVDGNIPLKNLSDIMSNDSMLIASSSSAQTTNYNNNNNPIGSVSNLMDYASNVLQNEMLHSSSANFPIPSDSNRPNSNFHPPSSANFSNDPSQSSAAYQSFLTTSHLLDSSHASIPNLSDSNFDVLGSILNTSGYASVTDVSPAAFPPFDIAGLNSDPGIHHVPMGLASYLTSTNQSNNQSCISKQHQQQQVSNMTNHDSRNVCSRMDRTLSQSITSTPQPWWKRSNDSALRRRKRRKNELEGLQSWTVNYPGGAKSGDRTKMADERTWDDAIGSYSQVLGERAKRRKRIARQTGNFDSDYVFEHDKDYPNDGQSEDDVESNGFGAGGAGAGGVVDLTNEFASNGTHSTAREMRSGAINRSYAGMDADDDHASSLGDATSKRRKKQDDDEPFEVRLKEPVEARFPHIRKAAESSRRRRERVGFGSFVSNAFRQYKDSTVGTESGCLRRFLHRLNTILESVDDTDAKPVDVCSAAAADDAPKPNDLTSNPIKEQQLLSEAIISADDLVEFSRDAAKLNATHLANQIPTGHLLNLLTILLNNIRDGANVIITLRPEEEADEHETRLWREVAMERVMRSMNASLTALLLMISKNMPREVYVEDVIERVIQCVRFQLFNCIYSEYDPAYRVENSAKENQSSIKSRRARERDGQKPKVIIHLYHKLVELVSNLAKLVKMQRLTDSLVLSLSSVGVSIFFVENVSELQLAALELVTAIFSQYEPHRKLIMEEILASLARLPSSKRNLRSYRLNSEDSIQMLTALSLLLVQSVIILPNLNPNKDTHYLQNNSFNISSTDPNKGPNSIQRTDDEVLVITSYHNALRTAHTFLLVFLRKSTVKGEDDYRIIFENFVNDLLLTVNKPEWPAAEVMLSLLGSLLVQQFNNKMLDQSVRVASVDYLGTVASTLRRDAVMSQLKEHDIDAVIRDLLEGNHSDDDDDDDDDGGGGGDEDGGENENMNHDRKVVDFKPEDHASNDKVIKLESDSHSIGSASTERHTVSTIDENGFAASPKPLCKIEDDKPKVKKSSATRRSKAFNDPISQLDRVQALRDAILDYLAAEECSPTAVYARKFYLAQWLDDCTKETERAQRSLIQKKKHDTLLNGDLMLTTDNNNNNGSVLTNSNTLATLDQDMILAISERRRQHILMKIFEAPDTWKQRRRLWTNSFSVATGIDKQKQSFYSSTCDNVNTTPLIFQGTLDYEDCCLVCRYLATLRPFSQSFDVYLSQICKLLSESSVAVRTKALRCLSAVVEADPNVLARADIERAVQSRLLDTSTLVREAAVDLLGRFLGCRPELTAQYYPMLAERIRDKGVSVRKRVIRILRDICLEQPDFPRVPEICVKMIWRVNDEEGIKKLVNEVFQSMWFTPVRDRETVKLLRKVMNITDVVAACKDTGYEWFEQFLRTLLKKEEGEKVKPVEKACKQIADCLVQNIMRLEELSSQNNQRLVACLATLHMFTKIRPELMVQYTMVLQPYLSIRCNETSDTYVLHYVARIMEATVPLMEHPSETLVAQLEEDMVRLTLKHGKMVLESCVACLGAVVNRVSKNYSLARDCFTRFFNALQKFRSELSEDPERKILPAIRPSILRALFTVGLLCKHFDADVFQSNKGCNIRDQVFDTLMFFTEQVKSDIEMRKKALSGLGFLCTRHHELLCGPRLCKFYHDILQVFNDRSDYSIQTVKHSEYHHQLELRCIVLENLLNFFLDEERRMLDADAKWKSRQHQESLKEMGDIASGMGSSVAQTYLKDVLESFFSHFFTVRLTALSVITTILRQGLIHPVQTVPYLIAMQSDLDPNIRLKSDAQLQEIDHKFPGFLTMRATQGVHLSYRLQCVLYYELREKHRANTSCEELTSPEASKSLNIRRSARNSNKLNDHDHQQDHHAVLDGGLKGTSTDDACSNGTLFDDFFGAIRGTRDPHNEVPTALNSHLYSMLRSNRSQRRSLLNGLISTFDDSQRIQLSQLVYVADNLAHFPYQSQEEPLFVIHHIDLMVSMSGSGVLQSVREALFPELKTALEAALTVQAEIEAKNRAQLETQLRMDLQMQQTASMEALERGDHVSSEALAEQIQQTLQKVNNLVSANSVAAGGTGLNELRSVALVGHEALSHLDLGPLEEEEEDPVALYDRLSKSHQSTLPIIRDAIRTSRACVLLLTLKQFLKEVYSITDSKIQRYSPADSVKLWERPLTRRSGVFFYPTLCLKAAGMELSKLISQKRPLYQMSGTNTDQRQNDEDSKEEYDGEMQALVRDYLDFRKLILTIDPPGDDDGGLDELNTSTQSAGGVGGVGVGGVQQQQQQSLLGLGVLMQNADSMAKASRPLRTLVPQSHNKSSDEENESDDSNAAGASRLMLAQSAPSKRKKPMLGLRTNSKSTCNKLSSSRKKRKRRKRYSIANVSSSDEESDESVEGESEPSDQEC